ncbi:Sulfoxide reductase heme-binding subunit YedZ [Aquimixticola soesokkakensis]|uniref:Protein-methionine-sulfoxide reductase heme-binding subunit MsrQ n=1 Tax=Aquimixticola soesokkakensis TaxID=1519096 RepID=A0A1Y5TNF3_9RHOB|nr:protein-methionine-sulfoxide reductase heme-binding subunit MsrQ [Aquimixticola soesokkakensis]SLN68078.1 Sulfoxide reductase heme-binding subunit YedZ [Aquimixticola soesokkakensis]
MVRPFDVSLDLKAIAMTPNAPPREPVSRRINSALRKVPAWPLYILALIYPAWLFYQAVTGTLGIDPVKELEHTIGLRGLQVLIATLCVTPLRKYTGVNLIRYRRALGLIGFWFIFLHLNVWLFLDVRNVSLILADLVKRPYIIIGMVAFALLVPLALTSNTLSIRKLGRNWRRLHWLAYPATVLGALHFVILVKGWQVEPLVYFAIVLAVLATRISIKRLALRRSG